MTQSSIKHSLHGRIRLGGNSPWGKGALIMDQEVGAYEFTTSAITLTNPIMTSIEYI